MADLSSLLWQAATIMVTGMVVVFLFLTVLIFLVQMLEKIAPKDEPASAPLAKSASSSPQTDGISPDVVAAISVAVHRYRQCDA